MMTNKPIELGQIKSYNFNNKVILAIDSRWTDYFSSENPTFKVVIDEDKIMLIGPKIVISPTTKSTATKQEISDFD